MSSSWLWLSWGSQCLRLLLQKFKRWAWPELFSFSISRVSLLKAHEWVIASYCLNFEIQSRINCREWVGGRRLASFSHDGIFGHACWGCGCSPTVFPSIYPLHSSYVAPFTLSPAILPKNSYLYSATSPLSPSLWPEVEFMNVQFGWGFWA